MYAWSQYLQTVVRNQQNHNFDIPGYFTAKSNFSLMRHLSPHLPNSAVVFTVLAVMNSFTGRSLVLQTGKLPIIQAVFSVAWGEITEDTDSFTQ